MFTMLLPRRQELLFVLAAALFAALIALAPGSADAAALAAPVPAQVPAPPAGFGNIPFGTSKQDALKLNAGNGTMTDLPDKSATFAYDTLVAGMPFQVVQNFDTAGRAVDVQLTYSSHEDNGACVGRYNFVLAKLGHRYGRPTTLPTLRREDSATIRSDSYLVEFAFANGAAISATMTSAYPLTPSTSAKGTGAAAPAPAAPAGGAAPPAEDCEVTLHYLPPRWATGF